MLPRSCMQATRWRSERYVLLAQKQLSRIYFKGIIRKSPVQGRGWAGFRDSRPVQRYLDWPNAISFLRVVCGSNEPELIRGDDKQQFRPRRSRGDAAL